MCSCPPSSSFRSHRGNGPLLYVRALPPAGKLGPTFCLNGLSLHTKDIRV